MFTDHPNPDTFSELPMNPAQKVIAQVTAACKQKCHAWHQQQTIIATLKNMLTDEFEPQCFGSLCGAHTGFNGHSFRDVIS